MGHIEALRLHSTRLVDGPLDGQRAYNVRGRMACEGGKYEYVLGADQLRLFWVENPVVVEMNTPKRGKKK